MADGSPFRRFHTPTEPVQGGLELTALWVEAGQIRGRGGVGICQRRDQPVALLWVCEGGVIEPVLDHAHLTGVVPHTPVVVLGDVGQLGAIL